MRLDENFTLEQDTNSWTLIHEKKSSNKNDKGEYPISKTPSHHMNIEQALIAYCDKSLKPCESVVDVLDAIQILYENIKGKFDLKLSND